MLQNFASWFLAGFVPAVFWLRLGAVMAWLSVWVTGLAFGVYSRWFPDLLAGLGVWFVPLTIGLTLAGGTPIVAILLLIVGRLHDANAQLESLSLTDMLTGLPNRRAFVARVSRHLDRDGGAGALLLLDVDHFKAINDMHGHPTGDAALQQIAQAMAAVTRPDDCLGRLGGEEFGAFLPGADAKTAGRLAERLRRAIRDSVAVQGPRGGTVSLSVSVGGAVPPLAPEFETAYRIADRALYDAKRGGRDRVALLPGDDLSGAA